MSKAADEVRTPFSGRFYGAPDTIKDEGNLRPGEPTGTAGGLHQARHPQGLVGLLFVWGCAASCRRSRPGARRVSSSRFGVETFTNSDPP